jgi:lycopene cyclase domain-containing protein
MKVLILSLVVPLILSFFKPLKIYSNVKALVMTIGAVLLVYGGWDVYAVYRRHWDFSPEGVWNLRIINLPIEEALFFVIIPFCCIFTWEALNYLLARKKK